MLNQETKRRIDTARDILVGKVPDPKAQVEQITTALIYKFMDDIDKESVDLGGDPLFFVGNYAKYAWDKLLDSRIGGIARLNLYVEALEKMPLNPQLPELFRSILKDAFLPYRDPETLNLFLKEINGFTYDHSEKLGDAFEYLLSVLSSQGDAGQFRTPRHIIDFIVQVLDPQKNETILDPACGTAGFLISSYKHILKKYTKDYPGDLLTPDEREKLMKNFVGYDISPDMVRLSLVNMYLHGFQSPQGYEYDTLTSEERWDETFDIIMANPPFMSPKGGIRPHTRFSIQAARSEVLFVDYIAEHLNNNGRAGIIVPEGIIFQSGKAYKDLRKMLVDKYLWAVVSLPAGVFQPYSGVKTSILLLDKRVARKTKNILFINVENDGFELGAQRRPTNHNDLPLSLEILDKYKKTLIQEECEQEKFLKDEEAKIALVVKKTIIKTSGEYNLTGNRYRLSPKLINRKWPLIDLGNEDYFQIESGGTPSSQTREYWDGQIPWVTLTDLPPNDFITLITDTARKITEEGLKNSSAKILPQNTILVSSRATIGRVAVSKVKLATNQGFKNIIIKDFTKVDPLFIAYQLKYLSPQIEALATGGTFKEISKSNFSKLSIPLPPIELQQEIVAELERYQKIIDGAKQVLNYYKPSIKITESYTRKTLEELCHQITDGTHQTPNYTEAGVPFLRVTDLTETNFSKKFISEDEHNELIKRCRPEKGDILYSKNGTIGVAKLIDWDWRFSIFVSLALLKPKKNLIDPKYLEIYLNSNDALNQAKSFSKSGTVTNLHLVDIRKIQVPVPSLEIQRKVASLIEDEQKIVYANKRLIESFEQKIKDKIYEVWQAEEAEPVIAEEKIVEVVTEDEEATEIKQELDLITALSATKEYESKEISEEPESPEITQGALFPLV